LNILIYERNIFVHNTHGFHHFLHITFVYLSWFETKKSTCNSYMMTSFICCDKCVENANFFPTFKSLCIMNPSMLMCFLCTIFILKTCGRGGNVLTMNFALHPLSMKPPHFFAESCVSILHFCNDIICPLTLSFLFMYQRSSLMSFITLLS